MIPTRDTILMVEEELAGALAWAARHSVLLEWRAASLEVRALLTQPETEEQFFLRGRFQDYRAIAPAWTFTDKSWEVDGQKRYFPNPTNTPFGSSIFHTDGVLCVPFNRLAYAQHNGPHRDWGGPADWLSAGPQYVHAETLGDMLQVIYRDFVYTRGRMST